MGFACYAEYYACTIAAAGSLGSAGGLSPTRDCVLADTVSLTPLCLFRLLESCKRCVCFAGYAEYYVCIIAAAGSVGCAGGLTPTRDLLAIIVNCCKSRALVFRAA
jgi:hypothetical protein